MPLSMHQYAGWASPRLLIEGFPKRRAGGVSIDFMRPVLLFAIAALLPATTGAQTSRSSPAPIEIVNLEQHLWTTMAEGDFSAVQALFAKDFIEVDERIQAADKLLVNLKRCKLESYELRDLQVRILSPDSALTAYHLVDTFNCGTEEKAQRKSYDRNATTVWVRQSGSAKWLVQAHTETSTKPDSQER
jgi:hypothetical protein